MTEFSGFWTTTPSGAVGDQVDGYNQSHWSTAIAIMGAVSGPIGIAAGYRSGLAPTVGGANTVNIAAGGGIVDGKWHDSDATVAVNIPSAVGGGNTRIDRIVLRVSWAGFSIRVTRIAGIDAASPTVPAIITTSGTTYDIKICQVTVDTAGNCSINLDEREFAMVAVDNDTIVISSGILNVPVSGIGTLQIENLAVTNGKVADNAIDDTKVGNRVPQFYRRQGGSSSDWSAAGTTTYTPGAVRMQGGSLAIPFSAEIYVIGSVTFPVAFDDPPQVFLQILASGVSLIPTLEGAGLTASGFTFTVRTADLAATTQAAAKLLWFAVGAE